MYSLQNFLKDLGKCLSDNEIISFIRYADRDEDGKISYSEFAQALLPSSQLPLEPLISSPYKEKVLSYKKVHESSAKKHIKQEEDYSSYLINKSIRQERERERELELENSQYKQYLRSRSKSPKHSQYETPKKYARNLEMEDYDRSSYKTPKYNYSPMPKHEELHLAKALKKQIDVERELEDLKQNLALKNDFNLLDAFRFIDRKARGYVSRIELEIALNDLGVFPSLDELKLFFERYDRDSDGLMRLIYYLN